jgi:hypothetical protein
MEFIGPLYETFADGVGGKLGKNKVRQIYYIAAGNFLGI